MRQPREANSEQESQDYDSNDLKRISAKYQIRATLDVAPSSIEDDTEMARRWRAAVNEASFQSRARHFRLKGAPLKGITSPNGTASTENTFGGKEPGLVEVPGQDDYGRIRKADDKSMSSSERLALGCINITEEEALLRNK
uniref:Uncharacterized protein n=1 Tax=Parascaris univalens TaxID=6257 RepID=A0A915CDD7_PARUN